VATEAQALQLVALLEQELLNRSSDVDRNSRYYRGEQPLKYASDQFKKYHGERYVDFSDNWVAPVADAPVERLTVLGVKGLGEEEADAESWRVWQTNALDADSQLGFLGSVNSARAFVLVWGDPDDEETPVVTFEDASQCVIAYEPGSRRKRRAALKKWQDGNCDYATLYLPDEVWKFERPIMRQKTALILLSAVDEEMKKWAPRDLGETEPNPQPNPMHIVPMVELPNKPTLADEPISDVTGVIAMQDAVNLLWAQLFTASDYASFPQRIVLGAERPTTPILNDKGEVIGQRPVDLAKFAVDRVLWITGENSKIAEWQAANLKAYTDVIEIAVGHIAAQTRTPQHYLIGKMANLSGDALIAAETGLVKRVQEKELWFGQAIRQMFGLIALAQGNAAKAKAITAGTVLWADAQSRSQAQLADALLKLRQVGFPFEYLAAKWGLTPSEIVDLIEMKKRETEMDPVAAIARDAGFGGPQPDAPPDQAPADDAA